jgi:hypothetical protein
MRSLDAANPEHLEMVRRLEAVWDNEESGATELPLPSGDELASEIERFLREQGD